MKIEGAAHPFPFPIKERLPSYPRMFFPLPSEKTIRGRGKQNERGVSCCFPTTFSPQKGTFPLFPTFFLLSFCTLRFPLRKWDVSHWENETMMTIRKKDHLPVFSDLSAASFPFTSQIEGKQKSQREESLSLPFPVHSLCFPCSLELLCSSARKSATSLSISCFHFSDVFFIQEASGGAASCVSLPLSSLFSFPFSSLLVLTFLWKTWKLWGHPFRFLSSREIPNCRGLSLLVCLLFSYIGKGERRWRTRKESFPHIPLFLLSGDWQAFGSSGL